MPETFSAAPAPIYIAYLVGKSRHRYAMISLLSSLPLPCPCPPLALSNVPFLWRTIRGCPRDRFYFAPWHLSYPVTVEHCFLWRSMLDVPIALCFSRYSLPHRSVSPPPSPPVCFPVFSSSRPSGIVELKEWKIEGRSPSAMSVTNASRCYLNSFLMTVNHPPSPGGHRSNHAAVITGCTWENGSTFPD